MVFFGQGLLLAEFAETLGCDPNVITKAIRFWHESRGLPVPDGRMRSRSLDRKYLRPPRVLNDDDDQGPAASALRMSALADLM